MPLLLLPRQQIHRPRCFLLAYLRLLHFSSPPLTLPSTSPRPSSYDPSYDYLTAKTLPHFTYNRQQKGTHHANIAARSCQATIHQGQYVRIFPLIVVPRPAQYVIVNMANCNTYPWGIFARQVFQEMRNTPPRRIRAYVVWTNTLLQWRQRLLVLVYFLEQLRATATATNVTHLFELPKLVQIKLELVAEVAAAFRCPVRLNHQQHVASAYIPFLPGQHRPTDQETFAAIERSLAWTYKYTA